MKSLESKKPISKSGQQENQNPEEISLDNQLKLSQEELRKTQKELEKSQEELKALKQFFPLIIHDLKNPFNNILGFTDYLNEEYNHLDEKSKINSIKMITESAHTYYSLLEELLNWSRTQVEGGLKPNPENLNLNNCVNDIINLFSVMASNKKVELVNGIQESFDVFADIEILNFIIRNLVSNAIKFTPEGGVVTVYATPTEDGKIKVSVNDTGIGLSTDQKKIIFKSLGISTPGTNKEKGTGLGLGICINMAKSMGWDMEVLDGDNGKGTKFTLTLSVGKN